jgi:chromosome segregation ATPase
MLALRLLLVGALMLVLMPLWAQSSGTKSTGSELRLLTPAELQARASNILTQLRADLTQARTALTSSRQSMTSVSVALDQSQARAAKLAEYNNQIAARMQERDQDLAAAYQVLDARAAQVAALKGQRLRLAAALAGVGLLVAAYAVLRARRIL